MSFTPNVPYVEAAHKSGRQRPSLIVLQSSFTTSDVGAAFAIAQYMHTKHAKESFHFVVDEASFYQCVDAKMVATFAEDSKHTIGIQICDDPSGSPSRWEGKSHSQLLSKTADLVAELCLIHDIKPRFLTEPELQHWRKWRLKRRGGIVVHGFMADTYWPSDYFLTLVKANIEKHKLIKKN